MPIYRVLHKIFRNIWGSMIYNYGLNYILAALFTYLLVITGFDIDWYRFSSIDHRQIFVLGFGGVILGFFLPMLLPLLLFLYGRIKKNISIQITSFTLGQSAMLGLFISTTIKVFTGRIPPMAFVENILGGFQFGYFEGGAFNGWPSSHTTVAFAMAVSLIELYPKNKIVKICALIYACFIGLSISTNIHWFSDFVAGALIGYSIGKAVGRSFKTYKEKLNR